MIDTTGAVIGFLIMLGLMFSGLHVGIAMLFTGVLGASVYFGPAVLFSFGTNRLTTFNEGQ